MDDAGSQNRSIVVAVWVVFVLLLAMQLAGAAGLITSWWGVDQARFLAPWSYLLCALAIILTVLPPARRFIALRVLGKPGHKDRRKTALITLIGIPIAGMGIFWIGRSAIHLLGDGYLRIRNVEQNHVLLLEEPIDQFIHYVTYQFGRNWFGWDGEAAYRAVSILAGGLFLLTVMLLKRRMGKLKIEQQFAVIMLISIGAIQIFFGYVESYAVSTLLALVYLTILFSNMSGRIYWAASIVAVTCTVHLSGIVLLPSLCVFFWYQIRTLSTRAKLRQAAAVCGVMLFPVLLLLTLLSWHQINIGEFFLQERSTGSWVPLLATSGDNAAPYTLLSLRHIFDVFNEMLLIAPVCLFILAALAVRRFRGVWTGRAAMDATLILWGSYLLFLFCFDLKKGFSRDWDIFSAMAIPLTLWSVQYFNQHFSRQLRTIAPIIMVYALLQTGSYVGINAHAQHALDRFQSLAENGYWNAAAKGDAYDELRWYYEDVLLDIPQATQFAKQAKDAIANRRYHLNYAVLLHQSGKTDLAVREYRSLLDTSPDFFQAIVSLGTLLLQQQQFSEALIYLEKAYQQQSNNVALLNNLGMAYFHSGRPMDAIKFLQKALSIDPGHAMARENLAIINKQIRVQ
jgi:tetratricopeptide (TPR) repeat protein